MKSGILLSFLCCSMGCMAQSNPIPLMYPAPQFGTTIAQFNAVTFSADLFDSMKSQQPLIVYDKNTGLANIIDKDGLKPYTNPSLAAENMFLGVKIDSFNPNGATNFNEALGSGLLNLLFNGNRAPFNLR